jgi:hypothetical protein
VRAVDTVQISTAHPDPGSNFMRAFNRNILMSRFLPFSNRKVNIRHLAVTEFYSVLSLNVFHDQCCGSGIKKIPDPDFYPSRIPDPKAATKEKGEKFVVLPFFVATNITKVKLILFFNW